MRRQYRAWLEFLICLGVLLALPLIMLAPVISGTQVPMALRSVLSEAPWQDAQPAGLTPADSAFEEVQAHRYYPWYAFLSESAQAGESLLWNPRESGGMPFLALWRTRALSPFSLPFLGMPLAPAMGWSLFLKMAVAGFCAFYVSRRIGFTSPLALFAAIVYQLSGTFTVWGAFPISDVVPWLPLLLLYAERLALGHFRIWPAGALIVAVMAFGGDPEALGVSLLFALGFVVIRCIGLGEPIRLRLAVGLLLLTGVLGLALAGLQLVPFLEFCREAMPYDPVYHPELHLTDIAALFGPALSSGSSADMPARALLYSGVAPVLMLALWFSVRRFVEASFRLRLDAFLIATAIYLLTALLWRGGKYTVLGPQHFLTMIGLVPAWCAAAAIEEWHDLNADQVKGTLARLIWLAPLLWIALFALSIAQALNGAHAGRAPQLGVAVLAALVVAGVIAFTMFRPHLSAAGYGLAGLSALALVLTMRPLMPMTPAAETFPETAFVAELRGANARILGSDVLRDWPLSAQHIEQFNGANGIQLRRYADFMRAVERDPLVLRRAGSQSLLLTKSDIQGAYAAIRSRLAIQKVFSSGAVLFQDKEAVPHAWMAYAWRPVEAYNPDLAGWNRLPIMETEAMPEKNAGAEEAGQVDVRYGNDWARLKTDSPRKGVAVLADAWYPGWDATVDGVPAESFPVEGLFRGVRIGEGAHEIAFDYNPVSPKLGLGLSALAALVMAYGFARLAWERFRPGRL